MVLSRCRSFRLAHATVPDRPPNSMHERRGSGFEHLRARPSKPQPSAWMAWGFPVQVMVNLSPGRTHACAFGSGSDSVDVRWRKTATATSNSFR